MDKNITALSEYLMKEYDAILLDGIECVEKPPYNRQVEDVYLLNCFKFRPDIKLLDKMLNDPLCSQTVRETMLSRSDAGDALSLFEECKFPVGDDVFQKNFIKNLKHYIEHRSFPTEAFRGGHWGMGAYSYLDRTTRTFILREATSDIYESIICEFLKKDNFTINEAKVFLGLNEVCDIEELANKFSLGEQAIERLEEASHQVIVDALETRRNAMLQDMADKKLYVVQAEEILAINTSSDNVLKKFASLKDYGSKVASVIDDLSLSKQEYFLFMKNNYIPVVGNAPVDDASLDAEITEIISKRNFTPLTVEMQIDLINNINTQFEEELKSLIITRWNVKNDIPDMLNLHPIVAMGQLQKQNAKIKELETKLDLVNNTFVQFRNTYYNPINGLSSTTSEQVTEFVNACIDMHLAGDELLCGFTKFCTLTNEGIKFDPYTFDSYMNRIDDATNDIENESETHSSDVGR